MNSQEKDLVLSHDLPTIKLDDENFTPPNSKKLFFFFHIIFSRQKVSEKVKNLELTNMLVPKQNHYVVDLF